MNQSNISFLIPGYLPPGGVVGPEAAEAISASPVAMQWLSGLIQKPWQAHFEHYLGLVDSQGLHLPMARLMCEDLSETVGIVCADPVHLQADRDTAKLLPAEMLGLSEAESEGFVADINAFLLADNLVLSRREDRGWYLVGMDASKLASFPPSFLANRNASAYLPEGEDSGQWRRLMTELQMLLHAHPLNEQREQQGKLPVNSLWFWGGAPLYQKCPDADVKFVYTGTVYADDPFSRAACAQLQISCKALAEFNPLLAAESLVVDTRIADAIFARNEVEMHQFIEQIDNQWFKPLNERVKQGEVQQLVILNEDGDKGILTKELLVAQSRSENRLLQALNTIKIPERLKRWFNGTSRLGR